MTKGRSLVFVTGNSGKFEEVKLWINQLDASITVEQIDIDIPEHQSLNVHEIAIAKARAAYNLIKKPVLIDDGGLYLEKYHNFPGPLSKYVYEGIGLDGTWLLAQADPRAYFLSCLVYIWSDCSFKFFEGVSHGVVIAPTETIGHKKLPYASFFVPTGAAKTFAAMRGTPEEEQYHHRYKAVKDFVTWFKNQEI